MVVKIKREVELADFSVPALVSVENDPDGFISLNELNWESLNRLCDNFRKSIFRIAKVKDSRGGL